ncbi:MAG: asparagine synthase (glutamine-hydrolyzing) [Acidobacteria bacterium]|nr:asparagine synthase (glutamine-hydrolyzing) [Acidobacteriota bacterium]
MCGIAGILRFNGQPAESREAEIMARVLSHRGPDGQGIHLDGPLALAHRRLSIIDLSSRANQPMSNEDGTVWVIHNGEIYNFLELRPELESKGHVFRSSGDSEVILHAYEEEGEDCVRRFNGMWAFALWDARRRRLLLSRDRLGEKPLYYVVNSDGILFASEAKALLALRPELAEPSLPEMAQFLAAGLTDTSEATMFRRVRQLLPGHHLVAHVDGRHEMKRYWAAPEPREVETISMDRAARSLRELLEDSVRLRLRSDVPVGTCLSGGLDSSSLVAVESSQLGSQPIHTFSSVFQEREFSEGHYVNAVNSAFTTVPHRVTPSRDFSESLPRILWHQEVPIPGPGIYPQWCVMGLAEGKVKVLLDGQGADELLGGYFYFYPDHFADLLRSSFRPAGLWQLAMALARVCRRSSPMQAARLLKAGLRTLQGHPFHAGFKAGWHTSYLTADAAREVQEHLGPAIDAEAGYTAVSLHREVVQTSLPILLHYEDRSAMAHGIETRVPYLDHRLVEFCMRLPGTLRIHAGETKAPLRRAMNPALPPVVARRIDKLGYPEPLANWLRQEAHGEVEEILLSQRARARGILIPEAVERDLREHRGGRNRVIPLYRALTLELWFRIFVDGEGMSRFGAHPPQGAEEACTTRG